MFNLRSRISRRKGSENSNGWHARFVRQELKGYSPIITGNRVLAFFIVATIILIPLGAAILAASLGVVEYKVRYDNVGPDFASNDLNASQSALWGSGDNGVPTSVSFTTTKRMEAPVYVYYELQRYYQNHKRYVRSMVSAQLGGEDKAANTLGQCAPQNYVNQQAGFQGLPDNAAIDPCGLVAYSYFNDTFAITTQQPGAAAATPVTLDETNIAWSSDRNDGLYGSYEPTNFNSIPAYRGGGTIVGNVNEDQHFLVWMRPAAARTVRKLYAVIHDDIPAGTTITALVSNKYNTYSFAGSKWVIYSTNSWVGGRNNALGIIFLVMGGLAFVTAVIFFCSYHLNKKRRAFADPSNLSWNQPERH